MQKMITKSFTAYPDEMELLRQYALMTRKSMSAVIREAVREYQLRRAHQEITQPRPGMSDLYE